MPDVVFKVLIPTVEVHSFFVDKTRTVRNYCFDV